MTTVYKVVRRRRDGQLVSVLFYRPPLCLVYEQGKPTFPPDGMKPLAFGNVDAAEDFRGHDKALEVWEAEAENPKLKRELSGFLNARDIKRFWDGAKLSWFQVMDAPKHTVACDSITLIKRVDGGDAQT